MDFFHRFINNKYSVIFIVNKYMLEVIRLHSIYATTYVIL